MVHINAHFINSHTHFPSLIGLLNESFSNQAIIVPERHHHSFGETNPKDVSTLLVMPAWENDKDLGVKIVTVNPKNANHHLPSIQGIYIYMDAVTGVVKATMDGKALTVKRTAASSALASSFLSKKTSNSLLMIGTGALSSELIKAHATVRPIEQVYVWGRNFEKAKIVCSLLAANHFEIQPIEKISDKISEVDIISCATLATEPLILNHELGENQHIDLVGSFKRNMREADDATVQNSLLFVDTKSAIIESGDLSQPLENGIITESDIKNDLHGVCRNGKVVDRVENRNTVFKSVGYALEDLVAAKYYYNKYDQS